MSVGYFTKTANRLDGQSTRWPIDQTANPRSSTIALESEHIMTVAPLQPTDAIQPRAIAAHTLAAGFERSGVGLHSGQVTTVRVLPARPGDRDRYFVRTDLPHAPVIPAQIHGVRQTLLATELVQPHPDTGADDSPSEGAASGDPSPQPATVKTVEHLLAALAGAGVDVVRIEIDGSEVPLLDGSARDWCEAIASVGLAPLANRSMQCPPLVTEPIWIREEDAFVAALPASELRFSYGIDFALAAIGNQWHSWSPGTAAIAPLLSDHWADHWAAPGSFAAEIAPARTFGLAHQVDQLRAAGLIQGGSLDNALVCGESGWLNPPLRFPNEPARHKILDLVGDLSLLGTIPTAHYLAYKASHRLHAQLAHRLAQIPELLTNVYGNAA